MYMYNNVYMYVYMYSHKYGGLQSGAMRPAVTEGNFEIYGRGNNQQNKSLRKQSKQKCRSNQRFSNTVSVRLEYTLLTYAKYMSYKSYFIY